MDRIDEIRAPAHSTDGLAFSRHRKLGMFDALDATQGIGERLDFVGLAPQHHHFQAVVMIQVDMER